MATIAAPHSTVSASAGLTGLLAKLGRKLVSLGENHPRLRQMERLMALSDAELAARGLTREGIARHVFKDVYYV
ncbi:MAG: DUF1127 domain-containing protein [Roseivivax sp.]|nr:DUF1127 domain-containing protein [Roseivivax sp.]